jgi:DnaJ-class molecular chaperone
MTGYTMPHQNPCPGCQGSGTQRNIQTGMIELCPICHGSGTWHTGPQRQEVFCGQSSYNPAMVRDIGQYTSMRTVNQ